MRRRVCVRDGIRAVPGGVRGVHLKQRDSWHPGGSARRHQRRGLGVQVLQRTQYLLAHLGTAGILQGTFGILQGTFGIRQGTFGIPQGTWFWMQVLLDFGRFWM